ncbi:hypothetical protein TKK_0003122 [Trichogramma kaykai]|uniref:Uncharacterized protein n=2 Tax=Trichogramma kaykai TaxID=54128 RepID=A0ABD2WTC0_9HYME
MYFSTHFFVISHHNFYLSFINTNVYSFPLFQDFILEHYSEHGENYEEAIAEFMETRMAMRTPTRDFAGIGLLMRYYNQLYFIERRHCAAALLDHPISEFRAETRAALERIQANDSKTQVGQAAALEPVQKIPRWRQRQRRRSGKQSR